MKKALVLFVILLVAGTMVVFAGGQSEGSGEQGEKVFPARRSFRV